MKNMKVKTKLLVSFIIVVVLAVIVGAIGIVGMITINNADTELYEVQTKPLPTMGKVLEYAQRLRVQMRNAILYTGDAEQLATIESEANDRMTNFEAYMAEYDATIVNPDARTAFDNASNLYYNQYKPALQQVLAGAKAGQSAEELVVIMTSVTEVSNQMITNFETCMDIKANAAKEASDSNGQTATTLLVVIVVVLAAVVIVSMTLAIYIARMISKPLVYMKNILQKIGAQGKLRFSDDEWKTAEEFASARDEAGQSVAMLLTTIRRLAKVGEALETVADKDLTSQLDLLSDDDTMGVSLKKMNDNLNYMFGEINSATAQVSIGSKQIADGAQALAQGSTEQAASVEELSSSIAEVAEKTRANAEMANQAATLAHTIMENAQTGSNQMDQMIEAVREINQASQNINSVIKSIDDIAFQTNILALNAAVEAARAGSAGKGFAVVAEEVRNLAAKSAEAAKDSGGLIASSIEKAELGVRIAGETAASLTEIVSGINESNRIVGTIAVSSDEQSTAISEINRGIDQVAQVVQQNSATAQESAAASEEMSGQSNMLEELVAQFKLRDGNARTSFSEPRRNAGIPASSYGSSPGTGLGKY